MGCRGIPPEQLGLEHNARMPGPAREGGMEDNAAAGNPKDLLREAKAPLLHIGKGFLADLMVLRRPPPEPEGVLMRDCQM